MSGIYIKGMEMPTDCSDCFACHVLEDGGLFCEPLNTDLEPCSRGRLANCPLIPVPPHGDLIGRDELIENCMKEDSFLAELLFRKVSNAPTIIPAEEEGT